MATTITPVLIEKEDIPSLKFPKEAVARTPEQHKELVRKLQTASTLGNIHHNKIAIIFEDDKEAKEVRTTVWAAGDDFVVLKQGITIPIRRIVEIKL
ncbi:MAG: hypothetical protein ACK4K0_04945 [Flavobacteriales bacterium]